MASGQGLSLQTIIVAVLVLIVLIVLISIFSGRMSIFGKASSECTANGGVCQLPNFENKCGLGKVMVSGAGCPDVRHICCINI